MTKNVVVVGKASEVAIAAKEVAGKTREMVFSYQADGKIQDRTMMTPNQKRAWVESAFRSKYTEPAPL